MTETEADSRAQTDAGVRSLPRYILRLLLRVAPKASRTKPIQLGLFVLFAYLFLWVPDLDLAFLGLLYHRSIVTHSLLPGLLFLIFARNWGAAPVAGALLGISVHLSADMLSPSMVGFAQIWLPAPWSIGLGPVSYFWMAGNAILGFAVASFLARASFGAVFSLPIVFVCAIITGGTYGWVNEEALLSMTFICFMVILSLAPEFWLRRYLGKSRAGESRSV